MKRIFFLIFILLSSAFFCHAQINIENSPFADIPISEIHNMPPPKEPSKKELKELRKRFGKHFRDNIDPISILSDLNFDLNIDFARLANGKVATFFTAQIENRELAFTGTNGLQTANVNFFGRVTSIDKNFNGMFEGAVSFSANADEPTTNEPKNQEKFVRGVFLPPAAYKIVFAIRDLNTGKYAVNIVGFTVPNSQN